MTSPVVHLELHTPDLAAARSLYGELCAWRQTDVGVAGRSYLALELGPLGGGIVECETERPLWLPYMSVGEIEAATDRARRLGASVLHGPREGPGGWRSVVSTPAGGEIGFWQAKTRWPA